MFKSQIGLNITYDQHIPYRPKKSRPLVTNFFAGDENLGRRKLRAISEKYFKGK